MIAAALLADTKALVRDLVDDLRAHAAVDVVDAEYQGAKQAGRTALSRSQWAEGLYAQGAVAWVLGCVFVRFCEDNGLVSDALLSGPGSRREMAREQRAAYLQEFPAHDDRDWLRHVFSRYRKLPATGDIYGEHNPVWMLQPSADGARELLALFQRIDPETGRVLHDFTDPTLATRFLGDLYQDLSDHARDQFALLQTPAFVEEFILDRTLDPALDTFGLRDTDLIDPTCGSGHFLLGAFDRLFERWLEVEPGTNRRELAKRSLAQIAGVDINPFAVAIARFRLLVAALKAGGDARLEDAPIYPISVAVGDSLLHGDPPGRIPGTSADEDLVGPAAHGYSTEDVEQARRILRRRWKAVVGNPPYIRGEDKACRDAYRRRFRSCTGKFTLSIPFTELFWHLAHAESDIDRSGFVGLINAEAFMKAAFGRRLVDTWFPAHDVTLVVDARGAYIPGHGTPTVLLFGRNRLPGHSSTVDFVQALSGEPETPAVPSEGRVWKSILAVLRDPSNVNPYVEFARIDRTKLYSHPWNIAGGGASELFDTLRQSLTTVLGDAIDIGVSVVVGEEEPFCRPSIEHWTRLGVSPENVRPLLSGASIRDWLVDVDDYVLYPYDDDGGISVDSAIEAAVWPWRTVLEDYVFFGKKRADRGLRWFEYGALMRDRLGTEGERLALAYKVTHNHASKAPASSLLKQTAPVIMLRDRRDRADLNEILAYLNSSLALFCLKQMCRNVGDSTDTAGARVSGVEAWIDTYQYDGKAVAAIPFDPSLRSRTYPDILRTSARLEDSRSEVRSSPASSREAAERYRSARLAMVGLQEQLDWEVYRLYGLIEEDLTLSEGEPPLELGQRAFEIVLARKMAAGEVSTTWFERHRSTPVTELPSHWSDEYRRLVERRIELIGSDKNIGLIERPEFKRRWNTTPWEAQQQDALRGWLLDRLESTEYWPSPSITTVARLAAHARTDPDFMSVARLYAGRDDVDVAALIGELVKGEAVPFLAALRYKPSGMRKWEQWCETWELQRREDAGDDVGEIPVPPKYTSADFLPGVWMHRGKLDVPKERFISYPGAESETDTSLVVGWAGWDHLDRARALATLYLQAKREGRAVEQLTPMLAGLAELVPWLLQWYDEPNTDPALDRPGSQIRALVDSELRSLHLTPDDLSAWRPPATTKRRSKKTT
ncbi:MAG: BREX-2 system adenine-specific DNA-methyltransferase PglX [Ilumatobacter fluminis]|uniref:BREX-2 system adenine-specific DNA-methyltransferase PglX n=1 Tax=Ilumatobacter fluminis TaxID=467091 RepID=UPI0032F03B1C